MKIRAIKVVREETGIGLAKAKNLIESLPNSLKAGLTQAQAASLAQWLVQSGMDVIVKDS